VINGLIEKRKIDIIFSQLDPLVEIGVFSIDCSCAISPRVAYVDFNGNVYSCAELAIVSPKTAIASLFDDNFADKFQRYHSNIKIPSECRYSLYSAQGIDICLNYSDSCPAVKGGGI
jgi:sulfatase maturation enzyme AslB (radical SAM superfamily)